MGRVGDHAQRHPLTPGTFPYATITPIPGDDNSGDEDSSDDDNDDGNSGSGSGPGPDHPVGYPVGGTVVPAILPVTGGVSIISGQPASIVLGLLVVGAGIVIWYFFGKKRTTIAKTKGVNQ